MSTDHVGMTTSEPELNGTARVPLDPAFPQTCENDRSQAAGPGPARLTLLLHFPWLRAAFSEDQDMRDIIAEHRVKRFGRHRDLALPPLRLSLHRFLATAAGLLVISIAGAAEAESAGTVETRHCLPMSHSVSEELRELDAATELLGQSGYFGNLLRMSGVKICVDPLMMLFRGYVEPDEHVIVIGANASMAEKALILAHELRHVDQAARGYAASLEFDMRENVRLIYALEADAQAITVLFAWSMREAGNLSLWQALKTLEHVGDMAVPFEAAMLAGEGQIAATRAAFSAWYRSRWRVESYFTAGAGAYLDQLDETRSVQSYRALPKGHYDRLCLMPNGGNYACRAAE
jgi:hypothetical protein